MPTTRPFAYNTGTTISGTVQYGNIVVGVDPNINYAGGGGNVRWWNGPDEDNGYVIAYPNNTGNQPNPDSGAAYLGFKRSVSKTENSFIELTNKAYSQSFTAGTDAMIWLTGNGYWTSYVFVTPTPTPTATPTPTPTPTPTATPTPTPTPTPITPVTTNLTLYYDPSNPSSYIGSGTTINDLSGNGLNGTMSNITFTSPYFTYNGTTSQISRADNSLLEPGSGDWTMESWVYLSNITGSKVILGKFDNGGLSQDVSYSMRVSGANIYAQFGDGSGAFINSTSHTATINTWYQVVYVFKNIDTNNIETFINGTSIGNVSHTLPSLLNSTNPLYVGSYNGGEFSQWMNGRIGITRLYNTSLTSAQVLQNFNSDKSKYGL